MAGRLAAAMVLVLALLSAWRPASSSGAHSAPLSPGADTWRNYTNGNYVYGVAARGDFIWAATSGGVVRWDRRDGSHVKYTPTEGVADSRMTAATIDGEGHVWLATEGSGVSRFDGSGWTTYTTADGLVNDYVFAIAAGEGGQETAAEWVGTAADRRFPELIPQQPMGFV